MILYFIKIVKNYLNKITIVINIVGGIKSLIDRPTLAMLLIKVNRAIVCLRVARLQSLVDNGELVSSRVEVQFNARTS